MANIKFDLEEIKYFINHNFRELIISIVLIFICITLVVGLFTFLFSRGDRGEELRTELELQLEPEPLNNIDKDFLVNRLFEYPHLDNFDVTNDYISFMPLKTIKKPDINIIVDEYDKLVNETIDEACKFKFEKRRGK